MFVYLRSYKKNSTDWVTRKCLSSLQKLESKSSIPARMVSPAASLLGLQTATTTLSLKGLFAVLIVGNSASMNQSYGWVTAPAYDFI